MNLDLILDHPLAEFDPMARLADGSSLPVKALDPVLDWADAIYGGFGEQDILYSPREPLHTNRGMTTSLTTLARDSFAFVKEDYETFEPREYEAPAGLFLATDLIIRQRVPLILRVATAREVAERRGWNTVEDVTASLLDVESRLVLHGEVVLRLHPKLLSEFVADDDNRSYEDTMNDIRRRLDFIENERFKALFATSKRTPTLVEEAEALSRDANRFRQSRETSRAAGIKVTLRRNVLYTAWSSVLTTLQKTLRGALTADHPDLLDRIEAKYWTSLATLSRKARRPKPEDLTETGEEPEDGAAVEETGEDGEG